MLIIDDHQDSLAMYAFGLLAMGFLPVTAGNAEDGLARASELHPDVIVANASVLRVPGLDLSRRLRDDVGTRDAALIVLADAASESAQQRGGDVECDRLVPMPCMPDALAFEIRHLLSDRDDAIDSGTAG